MIKQLIQVTVLAISMAGPAYAQVDANRGDQAALDGVKWIGPTISGAILEERKRRGLFKDWPDFERRVKGIDERRALALSEAGLTIDGRGRPDTLRGEKRPSR
ncbi:helix-hairpin-helix domain-containing protein [Lacisediminimonas sp.]|uniref:ComEA family DNA-binding protein n=1 Tax=Lacisediminimonas sp. TaxID=3060582 RepID=UPI0027227971|nr:helix-hairpin-helix domain-containing protein [Lacisediminimonas sp.]MDO8300503.1 helix-hairpin-helix domain-containing protein [Lacisediminimonas sp.]